MRPFDLIIIGYLFWMSSTARLKSGRVKNAQNRHENNRENPFTLHTMQSVIKKTISFSMCFGTTNRSRTFVSITKITMNWLEVTKNSFFLLFSSFLVIMFDPNLVKITSEISWKFALFQWIVELVVVKVVILLTRKLFGVSKSWSYSINLWICSILLNVLS